jgi:hypothetical protein
MPQSEIQDTPTADLSVTDSSPRLELARAMRALIPSRRAFVRAYVYDASRNAQEAYRTAVSPNCGENTAKTAACRLRARSDVQRAIAALETVVCDDMSREEVLNSYARIARSDATDLLDEKGRIDVKLARKMRISKKVRQRTILGEQGEMTVVDTEFEIRDPDKALDAIVKIKGYAAPTKVEIGMSALELAIRAADRAEKEAANTVDAEVVKTSEGG